MSEQSQSENRAIAILKPQYLLALGFLGLGITIVGAFQPRFGIMGWIGLVVMILAVVIWGIIAPEQVRAAVTGRTARYGGTAFMVTVLVLLAMIALYVLTRGFDLRFDVTQRDAYSIRPEIRAVLAEIAADENRQPIRLVTFLSAEDAGLRDRLQLLFDEIQVQTLGKISYEFVDVDQNPLKAQDYRALSQQIAVAPLDEEDNPIPDLASIIPIIDTASLQTDIVDSMTSVNLQGKFSAYFILESGGMRLDAVDGTGMSILSDRLRFIGFQPIQGAVAAYRNPESGITLNDESLDGEVMLIAGGAEPLAADDLAFIQDYLDKGGSLVILGGINSDGTDTLTSDSALTDYLLSHYGVAFNNDLLVDLENNFSTPLDLVADEINTDHFIGQMGLNTTATVKFIFSFSSSLQLAETVPDDVTVTPLITSKETAYAVPAAEIVNLIEQQSLPSPEEALYSGKLPVMVAAENNTTGSRLVLIGSTALVGDAYTNSDVSRQLDVNNLELSLRAITWASYFSEKVEQIVLPVIREYPADTAFIAQEDQISNANVILLFILPFGVLVMGVFFVWLNREREAE